MAKLFVLLSVFICTIVTAQTPYEKGMTKAFELWKANNSTEASAVFERIGVAEKTNWLPYYYIALVNTTEAFKTKDKEKIAALLAKAQEAQDTAMGMSENNAELLVMQAMIDTAWIVADPMTNGMRLSNAVMQLYAKAEQLAPNNPRVVFGKAEFELGGAKYFGGDVSAICARIEQAIVLFGTFKPEMPFAPSWGLERAQEAAKDCRKK